MYFKKMKYELRYSHGGKNTIIKGMQFSVLLLAFSGFCSGQKSKLSRNLWSCMVERRTEKPFYLVIGIKNVRIRSITTNPGSLPRLCLWMD